jgi:tetratricopeptide (TPR) repeat protein
MPVSDNSSSGRRYDPRIAAAPWRGEAGSTKNADVESAVEEGEAAAWAARDDDALSTALHAKARLRLAQGRFKEAELAVLAAVRLAEEREIAGSKNQDALDDALELSLLGELYARQGDYAHAAAAHGHALAIRRQPAVAKPSGGRQAGRPRQFPCPTGPTGGARKERPPRLAELERILQNRSGHQEASALDPYSLRP